MKLISRVRAVEYVVAFIVIVVLAAYTARYYIQLNDKVRSLSVLKQANDFRSAITLLHGQWLIAQKREPNKKFLWGEKRVYFTPSGWPANTEASVPRSSETQTAYECWQLWQFFFPALEDVSIGEKKMRGEGRYHITSIDNKACRFEFVTEKQVLRYFDYQVSNGLVTAVVPD